MLFGTFESYIYFAQNNKHIKFIIMSYEDFPQIIEEWRNDDYSSLIGALCNMGSDPFLIENDETAEEVARAVCNENTLYSIKVLEVCQDNLDLLPDFYKSCQKLDLTAAKAVVGFYRPSGEEYLLCFNEDWNYTEDVETLYRDTYPVYSLGYSTDEYDYTICDDLFYKDAVRGFEIITSDKSSDRYRDLESHCTGGLFWVRDEMRNSVINEFTVRHREED